MLWPTPEKKPECFVCLCVMFLILGGILCRVSVRALEKREAVPISIWGDPKAKPSMNAKLGFGLGAGFIALGLYAFVKGKGGKPGN